MCGISTQLNDTDPRAGYIAGNISFGPNALDGYVDEEPISAYNIYFVTACGEPIGHPDHPVAMVPKQSGVTDSCCRHDAYRAEVLQRVPTGSDRLVIVPVTSSGPLLVGELTELISDWVVNHTVDLGQTSGGMGSKRFSWSLAMVTFVTVASLLTSRAG